MWMACDFSYCNLHYERSHDLHFVIPKHSRELPQSDSFIFKVWRQRRPILYWCRPNLLLVNYLILVTREQLINECHCALVLNPQRLLTVPSSNYLIIPDPNNPSWQWFIKVRDPDPQWGAATIQTLWGFTPLPHWEWKPAFYKSLPCSLFNLFKINLIYNLFNCKNVNWFIQRLSSIPLPHPFRN